VAFHNEMVELLAWPNKHLNRAGAVAARSQAPPQAAREMVREPPRESFSERRRAGSSYDRDFPFARPRRDGRGDRPGPGVFPDRVAFHNEMVELLAWPNKHLNRAGAVAARSQAPPQAAREMVREPPRESFSERRRAGSSYDRDFPFARPRRDGRGDRPGPGVF